jgi:hypothetical protein
MIKFAHNNYGLTISLLILILFLLICNVTKLVYPANAKDKFQNTYNNINYFPSKCGQTATTYCPNEHPKVPCDMIKNCPGSDANITPEIKEYVDSYVYLVALMNGIKNTVPGQKWWEPSTTGF